MTSLASCPRCGAPLARGGALADLCPACLLAAASARPSGGGAQAAAELAAVAALFPELEVEAEIGRGGMGVVYRARQRRLDRLVAVKLLAPALAAEPAFAERFAREGRALARLAHENVVVVHDFGERDGRYYLLMEHVDGVGLRELLREGPLAPAHALALVQGICAGLQYAHEQGVVHRDVKPENILVDLTGRVKLADFGLAKLAGGVGEAALTRMTQVMGTPHYMAPEQISRPLEVDHRADIYALGVVLYEMLTGELPVGRFEPPSSHPAVDARLDEVVAKALEREPARRYQHASEVGTDVDQIRASDARPAAAGGRRRPGAVPDAGAVTHAGAGPVRPLWVDAVPGGALTVSAVALALAWLWILVARPEDAGFDSDWNAFAWPLAFVPLGLAGALAERGRALAAVLGTLAFATLVALGVLLTVGTDESPPEERLAALGSAFFVAAHVVYDRWVRGRGPGQLLGAVGLGALATIMIASLARQQAQVAYYFASGMTALAAASSMALLLPDLVRGSGGHATVVAFARTLAVAAACAALYFHRQLF